jgi:hypothetical protein
VSLNNGLAPGHVGHGQEYRLAPTAFAHASSRLHNLMSRADILNGWFNGSRAALEFAAMNACNSANLFFGHNTKPTKIKLDAKTVVQAGINTIHLTNWKFQGHGSQHIQQMDVFYWRFPQTVEVPTMEPHTQYA